MSGPDLANWKNKLESFLPASWQQRFSSAGARHKLLNRVNRALLVFDGQLLDLASGRSSPLAPATDPVPAELIAQTAAQLLQSDIPGNSTDKDPPVLLLLLPSSEFLITPFSMPGVSRDNLKSALSLQAYTLLPGYEQTLSLAVNNNTAPAQQADAGHRDAGQPDEHPETALWLPQQRIDALFQAFAEQGLFLAGIMPRVLAAAVANGGNCRISETDASTTVALDYLATDSPADGSIVRWLQIGNQDLQQEVFSQQWQQQIDSASASEALPVTSLHSGKDYQAVLPAVHAHRHYSFIPAGAAAVLAQQTKGKRLLALSAAAGVVLLLAAVPFMLQSLQARLQLAELAELREQASQARADQARVREFEQDWGVFLEYPRQNLPTVLTNLQTAISPGYLTALNIEQGAISLEGDSPDPQSLLELLEQNPLFTEVDFARATNNQRYFIDLRLSTADFAGYQAWYFPDARNR
ncbi:MAG: hypothetical protein RQ757_04345 [Pseudomonadales bacterium]|nr:hypothetical protein [Pseudomonadales bacterium]